MISPCMVASRISAIDDELSSYFLVKSIRQDNIAMEMINIFSKKFYEAVEKHDFNYFGSLDIELCNYISKKYFDNNMLNLIRHAYNDNSIMMDETIGF